MSAKQNIATDSRQLSSHASAEPISIKYLSTSGLRVTVEDGELWLVAKGGFRLEASQLVLQQVCEALSLPVGYILSLPATLAAQNVNHAIKSRRKLCAVAEKL